MPRTQGCGRKQAIEWTMVNQTDNKCQVKCKFCNCAISAKVERIRSHMKNCKKHEASEASTLCLSSSSDGEDFSSHKETCVSKKRELPIELSPSTSLIQPKRQRTMGEFTMKTSNYQKAILDRKVSEFFYANSIAFNVADSDSFKELIHALRPGYFPPNRQKLAGPLLDAADKDVDTILKASLKDATITLMLDGWSNTSADSIIAVSIHTGTGKSQDTYLLEAVDCGSEKKTAEFCAGIAERVIKEIKQDYDKDVFAVCCDNENKMKKFRDIIVEKYPSILAFGCSAHYMNLLAQEITPKSVMKHVIEIQKFFRNHNRPHGWLIEKGGRRPQLPNETRWNSQEACLSSFVYNYQKYVEISIEHNEEFEKNILVCLDNKGLYRECLNLQVQVAIVAKKLDTLQNDACTLSDTVEIWLDVLDSKELSSYKDAIKRRLEQALTPVHYLANMTNPATNGKRLNKEQEALAELWLENFNPEFDVPLKMYQIQDECYPKSMFSESAIKSFEAKKWWKVMAHKAEKNDVLNTDFCTKHIKK
ncbi:hypothetical protein JTE90_029612 [Oedothorax gibbosus]|uniref:DUF659 domain-containing protein n=1 Tax=Oedothorax gibbosus TaxID=931172 RepID=A0AAV6TMA0_9ARAC|nr:hypothetical protein JTE90_029612 [Oedothorax gibbosus]